MSIFTRLVGFAIIHCFVLTTVLGQAGRVEIGMDPQTLASAMLKRKQQEQITLPEGVSKDWYHRSMEQLMTDQAKNALMHNLVVELLRKQYGALEMALKERIG